MGEEIERRSGSATASTTHFQDETFFTYAPSASRRSPSAIARRCSIHLGRHDARRPGRRACPRRCWRRAGARGLRRVIIGVESGSQEMIDRIQKDIKLEQVFISAEKCRRHGVAVHLPVHRRLPGRDRGEHPGLARRGQAPARDEPGLRDADLLLQAVPRLAAHRGRRARRAISLPRIARRVGGASTSSARPGPWVTPAKCSAGSSASSSTSGSPGSAAPCGDGRSRAARWRLPPTRLRCRSRRPWASGSGRSPSCREFARVPPLPGGCECGWERGLGGEGVRAGVYCSPEGSRGDAEELLEDLPALLRVVRCSPLALDILLHQVLAPVVVDDVAPIALRRSGCAARPGPGY